MGFVALHLLGSRKGRGRAKRSVDPSWADFWTEDSERHPRGIFGSVLSCVETFVSAGTRNSKNHGDGRASKYIVGRPVGRQYRAKEKGVRRIPQH